MKRLGIIGQVIKHGDTIIYESTVYPWCTQEDCAPILERYSELKYNQDFFVGYSPERFVPRDRVKTLTTIMKVTLGSTPEVVEYIDQLHKTIIIAGTFKATSIKVAEASKAIENAQRDVNISFINEIFQLYQTFRINLYNENNNSRYRLCRIV